MFRFLVILTISLQASLCLAWTFTTSVKKPNHSLLLTKNSEIMTYVPNSSFHLGVKLVGDFFFAQYSIKIPNSNFGRSNIGNDAYRDLRIGSYFYGSLVELFYKKYEGFSSTENGDTPGCDNCLIRNDMSSQEILLQSITPIIGSLKVRDITSGANAKVGFALSPTLHIHFNQLIVKDQSDLIQGKFADDNSEFNDLKELKLRQLGLGLGFGFTIPFGDILYFGLLTSVSAGLQKNKLIYSTRVENKGEYSFNYNFRMNIGSHNPKYNIGIRSMIVSNIFEIKEQTRFASVNYEVRLYTSVNF